MDNINNIVGDELNKLLESINLIPEELRKEFKLDKENKLYINKLKHSKRTQRWKEKEKELVNLKACAYMKERYKKDEEFRKRQIKAHQDKYYFNKYGMTKEEYKAKKEKELGEFMEANKEKIDKLKEKDKLKAIKNNENTIDSEISIKSDKSQREKINAHTRHNYYMKRYNMTEQEYKQNKEEQHNKKMEKYKDKFNNVFIPSYVEAH
jgi:hypothetical protein